METQGILFKKDSLRFDGRNNTMWKNRMEVHLKCLGEDYRKITKNVYGVPQNGPSTPNEVKEDEYNFRAKEALLSALIDFEMTNVMELQIVQEIQGKLEILYEGVSQVKIAKLQSLKGKCETLKMGDDENIHPYVPKVNELVLSIRNASGKIEEDEIIAKVLRSLPPSYKHQVISIDEIPSVTTVTRDMLVGKLVAFELSEFGESRGKSETTFKVSISISSKQKYGPDECRISRYERERRDIVEQERKLDELEALISQRLPKSVGKYDGKLPFKYSNCNKIGHFASRFPERMTKYDRHDRFDNYDRNYRCQKHEKYVKTYKSNQKFRNQKNCYYVTDEGVTDEESKEDEVAFISIKEDGHVPIDCTSSYVEEKDLATKVEEKSVWVIDSSCSHHMSDDKSKFISMKNFDGGIVRFGDDKVYVIHGRGSIFFMVNITLMMSCMLNV